MGHCGSTFETTADVLHFTAGAMENWGLMTFAETYLLIDQDHSSSLAQELVLTLIAHELTHQWFGNLVTLSSWNEVW